MESDKETLSGVEIVQDLGKRFAQYRKRAGVTQNQVASQSGISQFTISGFENGSQTGISLKTFVRLMRAIGEVDQLDTLLPDLPQSPAELFRTLNNKKQQ